MCISTSVLYTPTLKTDILLYRGAVYPSSIWNFSLIRFGAFVPDYHRSVVKLLQCIFLLLHMRMTVQMQCCCFTLVFLFFFQIASLLSDASSVLNECMETFTQPQELKTLLDTQKDLSQLEDMGELLRLSMNYT